MMKMDLAALTNAITDIVINVTDEELHRFGLRKGALNNRCNSDREFQVSISTLPQEMMPAGSSANVLFNASAFRLKTSLFGTVGNDYIGRSYAQSVADAGIIPFLNVADGASGVCYVLVTPDGERTVLTKIGVAYRYDFDLSKLKNTQIFHTSGYELLTNPERTKESVHYAKSKGAKISFDLSDPSVVVGYKNDLENVLEQIDILFATIGEAEELTGRRDDCSIHELKDLCSIVALKKGKYGSIVTDSKDTFMIPVYDVQVANTCGAGDAYTAGFLYGYLLRLPLLECGHLGSYFASRVCSMQGSHF